jgi:hypothetical protein
MSLPCTKLTSPASASSPQPKPTDLRYSVQQKLPFLHGTSIILSQHTSHRIINICTIYTPTVFFCVTKATATARSKPFLASEPHRPSNSSSYTKAAQEPLSVAAACLAIRRHLCWRGLGVQGVGEFQNGQGASQGESRPPAVLSSRPRFG